MNRVFDALVAAAAADIARHRFADLVVGWLRIVHEQCGGLHDLAGLAIAALRHVELPPGLLYGVIARGVKALDRRHLAIDHVGNRRDAGAHRLLIRDDGARTAQGLAAAEFRARQSDFIAEKPE